MKFLSKLKTLLVISLLFFVSTAFSQSLNYIHYTTFDGLPSQVVYSILQDKKGFIWLGTTNGLCRFDGKTFKTYTTDDGMPDNEVLHLAEDKNGRIWLSLFNGGACYFKDEKFHHAGNDSLLSKIQNLGNFVNYFFPKNESGFYIYGGKNLYYLSYDLNIEGYSNAITFGKSTFIFQLQKLGCWDSNKFSEIKNGQIIGNHSPYSKEMPFIKFGLSIGLIDSLSYCYNKKSKEIFIQKFDTSINVVEQQIKPYPYALESIIKLENHLYLFTHDHLMLRCKDSDLYLEEPEIFLKGSTFNRILKDSEGGLWVSSLDNGLYYIPSENAYTYNTRNHLLDNSIYSITLAGNEIVFSDSKGNIYGTRPVRKILSINNGTTIDRILKMQWQNEKLYIATDRSVRAVSLAKHKTEMLFENLTAKDIYVNKDVIYYCTLNGLEKFNMTTGEKDTLALQRKTTLTFDAQNQIWYGELNGLYKIDIHNKITDFGKKYPELTTRVTSIATSNTGLVWVATQAKGLIGIQGDIIKYRLSKKDGLATNNLKSVFVSEKHIVTSSDKGIDLITIQPENKFTIRHINKYAGLADNDVNCAYIYNDTLYAGTTQGFSIIPLHPNTNQPTPIVYITSFLINGRDTTIDKKLLLKHFQNNLSLSFIGLSYRTGGSVLYRYKLNEADEWKYTRNTDLTFPDLKPGNYQFNVEAQNTVGSWSKNPAVLYFKITEPFWKEWWFLIIMSCIVAVLIASIYYRHQYQLRHELELNNNMLQSEIKALRAQMNPHFIFNSLNSIQNFIFSNKKEDANEYLTEFSKLMRMILDNSQHNFITVAEEVEFIKSYLRLERLRLNNKFDYRIRFSDEMKILSLSIPSMILQPFVENAIVHGFALNKGDGQLHLDFYLQHDVLHCIITDNGVGYKFANLHKKTKEHHRPVGILATADRIEALKKVTHAKISYRIEDLSDDFNKKQGTRVTLIIQNLN